MSVKLGKGGHPTGVGIQASVILVRYRSIPVPDRVTLLQYQTGPGIGIFFLSGTVLTGCQTDRHFKKLYEGRKHSEGEVRHSSEGEAWFSRMQRSSEGCSVAK
jgi:hypothetical protein